MEPPVRIELTTFRLQGGCSTTELGRRTAAGGASRGAIMTREKGRSELAPFGVGFARAPRSP